MDIGIAVGVCDRGVEVVPSFRIVGRHRADQRQLHVGHLLLDQPVGVDHAERVLPRIKARHLAQQRPIDVDSELLADVDGVLGREGHVLRRQRVDRRRHDVRPAIDARGDVLGHVEDRRLVGIQIRDQAVERGPVRSREVDVAAPHPVTRAIAHQRRDRRRLRVMHDADVPVAGQLLGVDPVVAQPRLPVLVVERLRARPGARCASAWSR